MPLPIKEQIKRAHDLMENLYHEAFFSTLNELGIRPDTEKKANDLLDIGSMIQQTATPEVRYAIDMHDPGLRLKAAAAQQLGVALDDSAFQYQVPEAVLKVSANLLDDQDICKAASLMHDYEEAVIATQQKKMENKKSIFDE